MNYKFEGCSGDALGDESWLSAPSSFSAPACACSLIFVILGLTISVSLISLAPVLCSLRNLCKMLQVSSSPR